MERRASGFSMLMPRPRVPPALHNRKVRCSETAATRWATPCADRRFSGIAPSAPEAIRSGMMRFAVCRWLLLFLGVAYLGSGRLNAAGSRSFNIGDLRKPDFIPGIRVGETATYLAQVRTSEASGKSEKSVHFSFACVGKCRRHGRWYGRCLVRLNGRLVQHCLAPWRADGRIQIKASPAFSMRLGTTKEKEKVGQPANHRVTYYRKKTVEVKDRTVMGHLYQHCLHYREERYNHFGSIEFWLAPDIGFVEATIRMNFGRRFGLSMNTRLESIRCAMPSS